MERTLKPKPCRFCRTDFTPRNSLQVCCSPGCALSHERSKADKRVATEKRKRERQERKELRERKEAIKPRSKRLREAQAAFNSYIRARDYGLPCISSGRVLDDTGLLTGSRADAGHYRSTGAAPHLRFNCWNCHAQSVKDNRDLSGNVTDYRVRLIERIGLERVERLEHDQTIRSFNIEYLKRVKHIFTRRARHYRKMRGN